MTVFGFDIEIARPFPEDGSHWSTVAPLGVTCAALCDTSGTAGMVWYSAPGKMVMSKDAVASMVKVIKRYMKAGHEIATWNGLGFDWRALGYELDDFALVAELAKVTYDFCYGMLKVAGFPVSLNNASIGIGESGKTMDGIAAVNMWTKPLLRYKVLEYVQMDATLTAKVAEAVRDSGRLRWLTKKGTIASRPMPYFNTAYFLTLGMPDQSFMESPPTDAGFSGWLP